MIETILGLGAIVLVIVLGVSLLLYFLPTIIAVKRDHKSKGGIIALNILLGWTMLVWLICLVWSLSDSGHSTTTINVISGPRDDASGARDDRPSS